MKETILKVNGMVCGGCENRVKNALNQLEGISKVEADYNTGIVKVTSSENVKKEQMEEIIEDIGFEVEKEGYV